MLFALITNESDQCCASFKCCGETRLYLFDEGDAKLMVESKRITVDRGGCLVWQPRKSHDRHGVMFSFYFCRAFFLTERKRVPRRPARHIP